MINSVPTEIAEQISHACAVMKSHMATTLEAIHLFGSALDGGLKPHSDIDLLVTVSVPPVEFIRRSLLLDLLAFSAPSGSHGTWRPLEVTVVSYNEVVPWRYPAKRELQFGEWLRRDLLAGIFEPAILDHDLAILLTKVRQRSIALVGPMAETFFEPVPKNDFLKALADTLALWNSKADWEGDERNVVLALARIWYSASTGRIAPKDIAAAWVLERLPVEHRRVLHEAREAYLGLTQDNLAIRADHTAEFILFAKSKIGDLLV
jgi:streptomycin 3"-adenylyltransferase